MKPPKLTALRYENPLLQRFFFYDAKSANWNDLVITREGLSCVSFLVQCQVRSFLAFSLPYYDNVHNVNKNVVHVFPLFPSGCCEVRSRFVAFSIALWLCCRKMNDSRTGDKRCLLFWKCTAIILPAMFQWVGLSDDCCTCFFFKKLKQDYRTYLCSLPISDNLDKEFITQVTLSTISLILPLINIWIWLSNSKFGKTVFNRFETAIFERKFLLYRVTL